jgi:hypothetical protein
MADLFPDLGPMEDFDFSHDARDLILKVFVAASETLDVEWKRYVKSFEEYISEPSEDQEVSLALQDHEWEEDRHRQRMQGVGALALDWLMVSLQSALKSAKRYLGESHPADPNPAEAYKTKKGWLLTVAKEYKDRFGIDFTIGPAPFDRIEELVFARNAGVKRDEETLEEYLAKVKNPRFIDDEDRFFVTKDALVIVIGECEQFLRWVVSEIKKRRPPKSRS